MHSTHHQQPEIWLRPIPERLSLEVLSTLIEIQSLTATPRLGARVGKSPKGYMPGQVATLRVFDEKNNERLRRQVRIEAVIVRPLHELTAVDLHDTISYHHWEQVQQDLSLFEGRPIGPEEKATIVEFSYL